MGVPTQVKSHPIGLLRHRRIVFIASLGETVCALKERVGPRSKPQSLFLVANVV
jgi:hypothetical protein